MAGVVNYNVAVREWHDETVFLHRIVRAPPTAATAHVQAGRHSQVIRRSRDLLAELESNFSATRRAPARAARRTRKDSQIQLLLFADPADEVIEEIGKVDLTMLTPEQALDAITLWQKRLKR